MNIWARDKQSNGNEQNIQKAGKEFLMAKIPMSVVAEHYDRVSKFNDISLQTMYDTIKTKCPAQPADRKKLKKQLDEPWDVNVDINMMMLEKTELLCELAEMDNEPTYEDEDCVYTMYITVEDTQQFIKECTEWSAKATNTQTETNFRTFWIAKYKIWDKKRDSLSELGIANSVVMTQKLTNLENTQSMLLRELQTQKNLLSAVQADRDKQAAAAQAAAVKAAALAATSAQQTKSDNTALTDITKILNTLVQQQQQMCPIIDQKKQGGRSQKREYTTKRYDNDDCCHTHGYDVAKGHTSKTCFPHKRAKGHDENHTGANPTKGANLKGKELSKWKDVPVPT